LFEGSFKGIRGQVIEAQDPEFELGLVYWFVGVWEDLLTVLVVFGEGSKGQAVLQQLVPLAVERMAWSR